MSKLDELAGVGTDQISDIKAPYLKIAQDVSAEMNKNKTEFMPELELGMFFCPTIKKIFGPTVDAVITATNKTYTFFDKQQFKGGSSEYDPSWRRDPKKGTFTKEGWKVVTCYNYLVALVEDGAVSEDRFIYTLKNSDIPHARDWNTQIKNLKLPSGGKCPLFGAIWRLSTMYRENADGKGYYGMGNGKTALVENVGFIPDAFVDVFNTEFRALQDGTARIALPAGTTHADPTDEQGEADI